MPQSARLEIHELNVGQGDSILIINRDLDGLALRIAAAGYGLPPDPIDYLPYAVAKGIDLSGTVRAALLIDAGDDEYGGNVLDYLQLHGVLETAPAPYCPRLSLLVSHYHDDHMAGLRSIFTERVEPTRPGESVRFRERFRPAHVYQTASMPRADPKTNRFALFEADVSRAATAAGQQTVRHLLTPGGFDGAATAVISLGTGVDGLPIRLSVLAAAQCVYDRAANRLIAIPSVSRQVDQNDRSIVLVLEYGSFRYFVGGDIAGNGGPAGGNTGTNAMDTAAKKYYSTHADVETTLGPALQAFFPATGAWQAGQAKFRCAGYCTVMKANHHGSSSSVDVYTLATLQPSIVVISSGVKTRFHRHPTQQVIDRISAGATPSWAARPIAGWPYPLANVANTVQQVYLTEVADQVRGQTFPVNLRGGRIVGDIILRPIDETIQAVQAATAPGTQLSVQVYGTGDQTVLLDPRSRLRPTEARNAAGSMYPIGPWLHSDLH